MTGGTTGAGGMCVPSTVCTPPGGQYCGTIGAGCPGQKLECGACPGDSICESKACASCGASCTPIACGNYCGTIGDGCGRKLDCARVRRPASSAAAASASTAGCVPLTCAAGGNLRYCGMIGDGCGGTLDCGTLPERRHLRRHRRHPQRLQRPACCPKTVVHADGRPVLRRDRQQLRRHAGLRRLRERHGVPDDAAPPPTSARAR